MSKLFTALSDRKSAAQEFRRWTESTSAQKPREVQVAEAGLNLLAGDSRAAHRLESELRQSGEVQAPIWIGELGWWCYLNADYQNAVALLSEAQQQRPTDLSLALRLGWAKIEVRRYADALQILDGFSYERQMPPEKAIVRAVIHWQAQEHDEALNDFAMAVGGQPQWENSNWLRRSILLS